METCVHGRPLEGVCEVCAHEAGQPLPEEKRRTEQQKKALHLWFRLLSEKLNEAGFDMRRTLREDIEIPWDKEGRMVKKYLWKPVQDAILNVESTAKCGKLDYPYIYEILCRHLTTKLGITPPEWPDKHRHEELNEHGTNPGSGK